MTDLQEEQLNEWMNNLSGEQVRDALFNCMQELIITDEVRFDESGVPYWEASGHKITDN